MINKRYWSVIIVVFFALAMDNLSLTAFSTQDPSRSNISEEDRRRVLDSLMKQLQDAQQGIKQPLGSAPAQQQIQLPPPQASAPAAAAQASIVQRENGTVQFGTDNAELYDFINQTANTLGLTPIVIDPEIKGTVNILSSAAMSKDDILPLFTLVLKNNNAALIKQGNIYQIVPISSALKKGVEIIDHPATVPEDKPRTEKAQTGQTTPLADSRTAKTSQLATHIIHVEFVPVKDLLEPVKLFMTEGGVIMPYERLNMLIITDYSDSAARVIQIIRMLDNSFLDPDLVELIKIKYNDSADVVDDLKKIFGSGAKDSATGISFASLGRINAIFVVASSKRGLAEAKRWIAQLDASTGRKIQTYVYAVENSTASNIATMLSALYGGEGTTGSGGAGNAGGTGGMAGGNSGNRGVQGGNSGLFSGSSGSNISGQSQGNITSGNFGSSSYQGGGPMGSYQSGNQGGYQSSGVFGGGQQLGPRLNANPTISSQVLRGGAFSGLQDTVRLVVDDLNNSLIIQATSADYEFILETIKKMDVLPRQVLIDARIYSVDLTNDLTFGVSGILQGKTDGAHATTGKLGTDGAISASTFAFIGNSREILMNLNALRSKTKVKILQAPSVLALDGMMARIVVGAEMPYPGSSYTPAAGGVSNSVQYRDTGISLIVVPRISAAGSITLQLVQEVSSPGATTTIGPSFKKTNVETTLSVKDGETVAIAGLINDYNSEDRKGIPFLSEIPILGSLFGNTSRNAERNELIILITPHVIRTPEKLQEMTQELKDSLKNARSFVKEKEQEEKDAIEDAQESRYKQEQKRLKKAGQTKTEASQPVQPAKQPELPPPAKQPE